MAAAQAAENHGDEWGLTWYFLWGIYTSIPTWTHSQNSLAAVEALSLKIPFHGTAIKRSPRPSQSKGLHIAINASLGKIFFNFHNFPIVSFTLVVITIPRYFSYGDFEIMLF